MSIYLKHFGLVREPFSIVPDPGFLYPSNHHRQAVAHLKYGLDREGGFILLTGEVGTGKTTLTRTMLKLVFGDLARILCSANDGGANKHHQHLFVVSFYRGAEQPA